MTVPLPPSLSDPLNALARRVRRLRQVRGLCLLVLTLTLTAAAALLADGALGTALPWAVRALDLILWVALGAAVLFGSLLGPLRRPLDPADLAAAVEKRYPDLDERLSTCVELAARAPGPVGPRDLIDRLYRDTESRIRGLDFSAAAPAHSARRLACLAGIAVLASLAPAAVVPRAYGRLVGRFLFPWRASADFSFAVEPGDAVAPRGQALTVQVRLSPADERIALPRLCALVLTRGDGTPTRLDMVGLEPGTYAATVRVTETCTYRVEAGTALSPWFTLTAATPTDLAPDSPAVVVTPPAYASSAVEVQHLSGMVDVTAFAHSDVAFRFAFDRPATAVTVNWRPLGAGQPQTHFLPLAPDGRGATWQLRATEAGSYRLVIEGEHGLRTQREGATIDLRPDRPPEAVAVVGDGPGTLGPGDRLVIDLRLADDVAVAGAELLTRRNDGPESAEPLSPEGADRRDVRVRHTLKLAGRVGDGDTLSYRVRFRDNRPDGLGGPQVRTFPESGWVALKVDRRAGAVREKEVVERRDALDAKLQQVEADLKQEKRRADRVRVESRDRETLTDGDRDDLGELRQQNRSAERALAEAARDSGVAPELADAARRIADERLRPAEAGLRDAAAPDAARARRDQRLAETDAALNAALRQLAELRQANGKHAQARLDREKVRALADRQQELAGRAASAKTGDEAREVARAQADLTRELDRLARDVEALKGSLEAARAGQMDQTARRARELARAQRDLARASAETEKKREAGRLAELEKRQRNLQRRAEALARETATPTRANYARPMAPDDARRAAESLGRGDPDRALDEQDRSARELDRLAREIDRLADQAGNPREAARQLSRLQDDLARRVREEVDRKGADRPLADRLKDLQPEQEALRRSAQEWTPSDLKGARGERQKALERQKAAEQALGRGAAPGALAEMDGAKEALRNLARKLPEQGGPGDRPPSVLPNKTQADRARDLAREQRAVRRATKQAGEQAVQERRQETQAGAADPRGAQSGPAAAQRREQQARQEDLTRRAEELAGRLDRLAPPAGTAAGAAQGRQAARSARLAESAMRSAGGMAQQGHQSSAQAQREQAARALDQAARLAEQSARPGREQPGGEAGHMVGEARERMDRAEARLRGGRAGDDARGAMEEAADRLRQAAGRLARPGPPGGTGASAAAPPDLRPFPAEPGPHVGKRWGELPGELRGRLVQQMKARYGDDYARSIRFYFEQLADTRRRP